MSIGLTDTLAYTDFSDTDKINEHWTDWYTKHCLQILTHEQYTDTESTRNSQQRMHPTAACAIRWTLQVQQQSGKTTPAKCHQCQIKSLVLTYFYKQGRAHTGFPEHLHTFLSLVELLQLYSPTILIHSLSENCPPVSWISSDSTDLTGHPSTGYLQLSHTFKRPLIENKERNVTNNRHLINRGSVI